MNNDRNRLYDFVLARYPTEESVRELCFRLFVNYDDLPARARKDKVRELIGHLEHTGRINEIHEQIARQHEDAYRLTFHATFQTPLTPVVTERNPRQVFISHAHQDSELAHRLAVDLERSGHPVWIAPESIRSGEDWVEAIGRGLDESAYFVVILTPAGVASRWVKREANLAARMAVDEELTFIPLWRESCRVPTLWDYQRVPFDQGYEVGLAALLARLGSGPVDTFRRNTSTIPPSAPPNRRIHAKTGIELIRIPAGPFLYGSADSDKMARANEKPQRTVNLPEYWIGRAPVTNAQFAGFVKATGHRTTVEIKGQGRGWTGSKWDWIAGADWRHPRGPESSIAGKDDHPVVQVSWDDAKAFCDWAGLALPAEEQWEKAARGADGRIWPWGNESPTAEHCNFNANVGDTTPIGQYSPKGDSPYGCVDMAGNVWEWMGSWYAENETRALRGGSWDYYDRLTRAAYRSLDDPLSGSRDVGFRVAELLSDPAS